MAETTAPTRRPTKPDQAQHDKEVEAIRQEITSLEASLNEVKSKIPAKNSSDDTATKKNELRDSLKAQLQQIQELAAQRAKLFEQINAIQASLKKKAETAKSEKDKLGYKSVEEIDRQIDSLESELRTGQAKLIEEKRMVAEISNLKKARKVLESHSNQQSSSESDKATLDTLRAQVKALDEQRTTLRSGADAIRAELNKVSDELKGSRDSITSLLDQRKAAKAALDAAYDRLRTLRNDFKIAKDEFYAWDREERLKRKEAARARFLEEREARILQQAERELEDAEIPAFQEEIVLCEALVRFLNIQLNGQADTKAAVATASRPTTANTRKVDDSLPSGATVVTRRSDRDDEFMVLGNKKGKKTAKRAVSDAKTTRSIKMDIEMINQFLKLQIAIPSSTDDISTAVAALEAKAAEFKASQAAKTAANKEAALKRIAELREAAKKEDAAAAAEEVAAE